MGISTGLVLLGLSLPWAVALDDCSDILSKGVFDELHVTTQAQLERRLSEVMEFSYERLESATQEGGGNASVAIAFIKVVGSGAGKRERWESIKQTFKRDRDEFYRSEYFQAFASKVANQSIVAAWRDCIEGRNLLSYYLGDPRGEFIVALRYVKRRPTDPDSIEISDFAAINASLVEETEAQEAGSPGRKGTLGRKLGEFEEIYFKLRRHDIGQSAIVVVSAGGVGTARVELQAIEVTKPIEVREFPVTHELNAVGLWKRIAGGDSEMDTDPGDKVPVMITLGLVVRDNAVVARMEFFCKEEGGNGTTFGGSREAVVWTPGPGITIKKLAVPGGPTKVVDFVSKGRVHGLRDVPAQHYAASMWSRLRYSVDSKGKNDLPIAGFTGTLTFTVIGEETPR